MGPSEDRPEPGVVRSAWSRSLNLGTALVLAVVLALLTFFLTSEGEPVVRAEERPSPTTITTAQSADASGGDATSADFAAPSVSGEAASNDPTEVGFVSSLPTAEYTWERVELGAEPSTELMWLGELNGNLAVVSSTWGGPQDQETVTTYLSPDGLDWHAAGSRELPEYSLLSGIVGDGENVYAVVEERDDNYEFSGYRILATGDGVAWTEAAADLSGDDADDVSVKNAAAGPAGLVLAVSFETYPHEPPILLDFGDFQVNYDHENDSYQLSDAATGEQLMSGPMDDVLDRVVDGQPVYDPATGELIVMIPYDVWEAGYTWSYEGLEDRTVPVPSDYADPNQDLVIIEYGGFVVEINEPEDTYRVLDAETGDEVVGGNLGQLYWTPPPRFVDPETGAVLLEVTWDEWYAAHEKAVSDADAVSTGHSRRVELLVSGDGESWTSTPIPDPDADISGLIPTGDGFIALVNTYSGSGMSTSVWTYAGGEWSSTNPKAGGPRMDQAIPVADGYVGIGYGAGGWGVWTSPNALDWESGLSIVAQSDGSSVYFSDVYGVDINTIAALAQHVSGPDSEPLVIEKDGYTFVFEGEEAALVVTDTSGDVVVSMSWDEYDETDLVTREDGVTYVDLGIGDVVAITDDEVYEAREAQQAMQSRFGVSVFLDEGGQWSEAIVDPGLTTNGAGQVYLVNGKIVIAAAVYADEWGGDSEQTADGRSIAFLVGTPVAEVGS